MTRTASHLCWQQPTTEVCELVLEEGKANIEETEPLGNTALNFAASEGHASTVALLLSKGAKVETKAKDGFTPLLAAVGHGHTAQWRKQ